jgi:hypothetical protein
MFLACAFAHVEIIVTAFVNRNFRNRTVVGSNPTIGFGFPAIFTQAWGSNGDQNAV